MGLVERCFLSFCLCTISSKSARMAPLVSRLPVQEYSASSFLPKQATLLEPNFKESSNIASVIVEIQRLVCNLP
jgi:hypothetical protein